MTYRPYNTLTTSSVSDDRTNNTGVSMTKGTPVRINNAGELDFVNVSVENEVENTAGMAAETILNGTSGAFVNSGKIENITISAILGDVVYISKTGVLTNIKPNTGSNGFISGDFVVVVGVVAKNESNPVLKDLIISIDVVGQL